MAKFFPITKTRTIIIEVPVGEAGEVGRERLTYELPEIVNRQTVADAIITAASEQLGALTEEVVAALLARAEEEVPRILDDVTLTVAPIPDVLPVVNDSVMLATQSNEVVPIIEDNIEAMVLVLDEIVQDQEEVVRITAGVNAMEVVPDLQEDVAAAIVVGNEIVPTQRDDSQLEVVRLEVLGQIVDDPNILVTATANEVVPTLADQNEAAIVVLDEIVPNQGDEVVLNVALEGYATAVASNTGFTNPNNALGNTTNTAATLTATSSGLLGTTNNTTNGTIQLTFRGVNLGDLIITSVVLRIESQHANAGVPIQKPTTNLQYQYSTNNGGAYTTFYTQTANTGKAIRTVDLTAIIGQNQALLNAFRVRATGNVTSGTGLGAASTASFFRAWLTITANRTYP